MEKEEKALSDAHQTPLSREDLEQHLRARAWKDDAFRQEFLTNPKAILERDYAQYFPEGQIPSELSIKVIEEEEQTLCFVLPPKLSHDLLDDIEDEDILSVSGAGSTRDLACITLPSFCRLCNDAGRIRVKL